MNQTEQDIVMSGWIRAVPGVNHPPNANQAPDRRRHCISTSISFESPGKNLWQIDEE